MSTDAESKFGELAVARDLISVSELLRCLRRKSESGESLPEILVQEGHLDRSTADRLEEDLTDSNSPELTEELELGDTMVSSEIHTAERDTIATSSLEIRDTMALEEESKPADLVSNADDPPPSPEADSSVPGQTSPDLFEGSGDRYEFLRELGRGGMGQVLLARDQVMGREIAIKILLDETPDEKHPAKRLVHEARLTGQLEHPNIVPTYDLGEDDAGMPFYTMRVVREKSLDQVLAEIDDDDIESYSLSQLTSILRQVSLALQYAHDHGVVHRDLKPENILIGSYGEVFIIDWGVAKVVDEDLTRYQVDELLDLPEGSILGTPYYMSPEQARGENEELDARADVYALGAVLYEVLTLTPVFRAERTLPLLLKVDQRPPEPPSQRAPDREIPAELEEICLKALQKDPDDRYQSAQAFADELEMFLEGVKERERRREMARDAVARGHEARERYEQVKRRHHRLEKRLREKRLETRAWAPVDEKEELWELEQDVEDLEVELERAFGEATRIYDQALGHVPNMAEARSALAELYWERFREAEEAGDRGMATYFTGLVRQYNDSQYDALLEGKSKVELTSTPPATRATLYRYEEVNRRLVERKVTDAKRTPIEPLEIQHGSYVFEIEKAGHVSTQAPVELDRLEHRKLDLRLYPEDEIPENFVLVPGGPFKSSEIETGDAKGTGNLPDFAMMRHPVTCGEYLEFLNALAQFDLEEAKRRVPRQQDKPPYFPFRDGEFVLPEEDHEGDSWRPDWPICMVTYDDAVAFAHWRGRRDGRDYRLPTAAEWEKAARGVDGRTYPWGNHFDASFCNMKESTRGRPMPAPVESFPIDRSPYGCMDMAGNVAEWTRPESSDQEVRILQGAAFLSIPLMCRLDWQMTVHTSEEEDYRRSFVGFRLLLPLGR